MSITETSVDVDPFTVEIIRNATVAITDEMTEKLMRSAYNNIIYEALDFTVGLFDKDGTTLSIGLGLPMFMGGLGETVRAKIAYFGADLAPGDVLMTNDPYIMGSHLNHIILTTPIFHDGQLRAFASTMAHWQDIGGSLSGATTDIYSEGINFPIVKVYSAGVENTDITRMMRSNIRFPERAMGDFRAQLASIRTGERRLAVLFEKYGVHAVIRAWDDIREQSAIRARAAVAGIPDGRYEAEAFMDDDGVHIGEPVPLRVAVEIRGDTFTIDLSDVSAQVAGYYNSGETAGRSAAQVAFRCLTVPDLFPINDGIFAPLTTILPPGKIVSATRPAAMHLWMTVPMTIVDLIFRTLADAVPERTIAAHHADLLTTTFHGHRNDGRMFVLTEGVPGGGWGATLGADGMSATICINDGNTHNTPIESIENQIPVLIRRYELREDSGGPGRTRGGLGAVREYEALEPFKFNSGIERTQCAPWGLAGGHEGAPNGLEVVRDGQVMTFPNGKLASFGVEVGDRVRLLSGGGGGFGAPQDRDRDRVLSDLRNGYISARSAVEDYGLDEAAARTKRDEPHTPGEQL